MARYRGSACRQCRREGEKLFLKGTRCFAVKCSVEKRAYAPGQHGARRTKLSNYGLQLREKQKVKRIYGVLERQFRVYFARAVRTKDVTGSILLQYLERRLDNVIYQLGFAVSRRQARQIVSHGYAYVNNRRVDVPSFLVKKDDEVELRFGKKGQKTVKENIEISKNRSAPAWLDVDSDHFRAKVLRLPERGDIQFAVKEQLIVELYSR